jgi:predicted Zn-dependent peptidase
MNEKIKTPEEIKVEIESVTAEQIMSLAQEIFVDNSLNLAIVGRFENKADFEDILKF